MSQPDVVVIISLQGPAGAPAAQYAVDAGVADELSVTTVPPIAALTPGLALFVNPAFANDGPSTIAVCGIGPAPIWLQGQPLQAGVLAAGQICLMVYDGEVFQLLVGLDTSVAASGGQFFGGSGAELVDGPAGGVV